jgi:hypothetical protein
MKESFHQDGHKRLPDKVLAKERSFIMDVAQEVKRWQSAKPRV